MARVVLLVCGIVLGALGYRVATVPLIGDDPTPATRTYALGLQHGLNAKPLPPRGEGVLGMTPWLVACSPDDEPVRCFRDEERAHAFTCWAPRMSSCGAAKRLTE